MREKITVSVQPCDLEIIDKRAKELFYTRSSYLVALAIADDQAKNKGEKGLQRYVSERKAKSMPKISN